MRARADVRARPVSLIAVTILVGLIGAVGIAAFAGARQTDSAYERYRETSNEPEAVVLSCSNGFFSPPIDLEKAAKLSSVEASAIVAFGPANLRAQDGSLLQYGNPDFSSTVIALRDQSDASVVNPQMIAGRPPAGPDEIAVGYEDPARSGGPRPAIGDTVVLEMQSQKSADRGQVFYRRREDRVDPGSRHGVGPRVRGGDGRRARGLGRTRVRRCVGRAGVDVRCGRVPAPGELRLAYAVPRIALHDGTEGVRPQHGGRARVRRAIDAPDRDRPAPARRACRHRRHHGARTVPRSAHVARRDRHASAARGRDDPLADRVGRCPARGRRRVSGARPIAVAGGIALSPLFPMGLSRTMDPDVGMRIDGFAVLLGVVVIALTTILSVVIPARRLSSARTGPRAPSSTRDRCGAQRWPRGSRDCRSRPRRAQARDSRWNRVTAVPPRPFEAPSSASRSPWQPWSPHSGSRPAWITSANARLLRVGLHLRGRSILQGRPVPKGGGPRDRGRAGSAGSRGRELPSSSSRCKAATGRGPGDRVGAHRREGRAGALRRCSRAVARRGRRGRARGGNAAHARRVLGDTVTVDRRPPSEAT